MQHPHGHLRCSQVMERSFATCRPDDVMEEVAKRVHDRTCPVVVLGDVDAVTGVIAPLDIERAWLVGDERAVRDVMTTQWIRCDPDEDARHLGARLLLADVPIAVVIEDGSPVGLVTLLILGRALHRSRNSHRRFPPRRRGAALSR